MRVASCGVRLPISTRVSGTGRRSLIQHPAFHEDALTDRCPRMLARQVMIQRSDSIVRVQRSAQFRHGLRYDDQRLFRMAESGGAITREIGLWMGAGRRLVVAHGLVAVPQRRQRYKSLADSCKRDLLRWSPPAHCTTV